MEGVGNEVSGKIRAAIKAKLIELGAYVDDELPDYIMVMVANKRSRSQMEDDLSLFLSNNTKVFTAWLHNVLKKLQEVTVAASEKEDSKNAHKKKGSIQKEGKSPSVEKKSKKKHSKKHKEKKPKKVKRKVKEPKVSKEPEELSDWESVEVPKKKVKEEKQDVLDVRKEVGKAIIGNLKEKHKGDDEVKALKEHNPVIIAQAEVTPPEEIKPVEADVLKEDPITNIEEEQNGSDSLSIIEIEKPQPNDTTSEKVPTVMVPTKELLKKHDELTQKVEIPEKPADGGSSDSSVSPEELRRQLLLSRAKKKLEERNLECRMRSNSPEVVFVAEKPKNSDVPKAEEEKEIVKDKEESMRAESPKLSVNAHSSLVDSFSDDDSPPSRHKKKKKVKAVVESRIVAIPEPEEPGLSSVVHVKPRQFAPHEKQANKNLILKAVAAAERSVAQAPSRAIKEPSPKPSGKRPKALYTRDLRGKRYEKLNVTLTNDTSAKKPSNLNKREVDGEWESDGSNKKTGEEENFISSKTAGKGKNETFIQCWLEEVEEAGKHNALIKPEDIDTTTAAVPEQTGEEPDEEGGFRKDSNGSDGRIEALQDGPQIVVTVDGLRSSRQTNVRHKHDNKISSKVDLNRISNRFAKIGQPSEEHEFKEKYKEFERVRIEKKVSQEGESKNKRLIAELSMKFGKVNRVFESDVKDVRERLGNVKREDLSRRREVRRSSEGEGIREPLSEVRREDLGRKREASKSSDDEGIREKREKKSVRVSAEYDDVRMKSKERCRFWPDCARGASCEFHHPSSTCKLLPDCKYGDKCLYIHPICRNDSDCRLRDCAYDHTVPRKRQREPSRESRKGVCKYDSYCKSIDCPYQHTKRTCKYGQRCRNSDCTYSHSR